MTKHIKTFETIEAMTEFLEETEGILIGTVKYDDNTYYHKISSTDNENFITLFDKNLNITINVSEEEYYSRYIFYKNYAKVNYLTFSGNGTIKLNRIGNSNSNLPNLQLEYSVDNGQTWSTYQIGSTINISSNDNTHIMFRGNNKRIAYNTSYYHLVLHNYRLHLYLKMVNNIHIQEHLLY